MVTDAANSTVARARRSRGFRVAARAGFALNGLLNLLIGVLAIAVAVAGGSAAGADSGGALAGLASAPGGLVLIWLIAVGTAALGLWMLAESLFERDGDRAKRWAARGKDVGKGIAYLAVATLAVTTALGGSSGGGGTEESLTARALATPGGVILVVAVGLGIIGVGGYLVAKGARRRFLDDLDPPTGAARSAVTVVGVLGYVARGIAFGTIGVLLIVAAATADSSAAGGLDDALAALADLPFGKVLLVAIGAGFIASGVYGALRARFARL